MKEARDRISIQIDPKIHTIIKARAKADNRSVSGFIETLILRALNHTTTITPLAPQGVRMPETEEASV